MKTIEEMNSFDDIDNYYSAEIPQFIQEILEERVEALKHCITYKKEIERLHSIIKEVREFAKLRKEKNKKEYIKKLIDNNIIELVEEEEI